MSFKIIVLDDAQLDIEQAYLFYKKHVSVSIAQLFKKDLQNAYKSLKVNPFYQFRDDKYRAMPLKKFPYLVFFDIEETSKEVKVIAVFNTNQNQEKYP